MYKIVCVLLILFSITSSLADPDYNCYREGTFRYFDNTCKTYYTCSLIDNNLVKANLTCQGDDIFNPTSEKCENSSEAVCINSICDDQYLNARLPDPNQKACNTYIQCFGWSFYYPVVQRCPEGKYYVGNGCGPFSEKVC